MFYFLFGFGLVSCDVDMMRVVMWYPIYVNIRLNFVTHKKTYIF